MPPPKPAVKIIFCVRQVWSATRGLQLDILFIMKYLFRAENRSTGGERPRPAITIEITANLWKWCCKIILVSIPPPKPAVKIMICLRQVLSSTQGLQLEFLFIPKYLFPAENRSTGFERPRPAIAIKIAANWSKGVCKIILISMPPPKPAVKIMFCVRQVWSATRGLQLQF